MPEGKPTIEKLAALSAGVARSAEPYASVSIRAGLPVDVIAKLAEPTGPATSVFGGH
jgi:hypothetical protein